MNINDTVRALKMPTDSHYLQVEGVVTEIKNGFVSISATRVKDKYSRKWKERSEVPLSCAARLESVVVISAATI